MEYPSWEYEFDIKEFDDNILNPLFKKKIQESEIPCGKQLHDPNYLVPENLDILFKTNSNGQKHRSKIRNYNDEIRRF